MMVTLRIGLLAIMVTLAMSITAAFAAVLPEEAAKLKSELNPLGAEIAGNADSTIPAWTLTGSL